MKKALIIAAIALFGISGMNAVAQETTQKACPNQGNCKAKTECQAGDMNKMRQPREFTEFAFEGVLLDINQQTRIDSLHAAIKANMPAKHMDGKRDCKNCPNAGNCDKQCDKKQGDKQCDKQSCDKKQGDKQCDKQSCDKKQGDKQCCENKANNKKGHKDGIKDKMKAQGINGMPGRGMNPYGEEYILKVKEILTPEQFSIFMNNIESMRPQKGMPGAKQVKGIKAPNAKKAPKAERQAK